MRQKLAFVSMKMENQIAPMAQRVFGLAPHSGTTSDAELKQVLHIYFCPRL
jgi:hypothetical protein